MRSSWLLVLVACSTPDRSYRETIPETTVAFDMVWLPEAKVWIGRTEVTWDEYEIWYFRKDLAPGADAKSRPSASYEPPDNGWGAGKRPAIKINKQAAERYCEWLTERTGKKYRLPTAKEWELAAGPFDPETAWLGVDQTQEVAKKMPNAFGIFDMYGNAREYVADSDHVYGGGFDGNDGKAIPYDPEWNSRDPQRPRSKWWVCDGPFLGFRVVCEGPLQKFVFAQPHMGTTVTIVLYAAPEEADRLANAAFAEIAAVDRDMSLYKAESELSRLNQSGEATVSESLREVLVAAEHFREVSEGAFDVTLGTGKFTIEGSRVKLEPGTKIDLGGIAKGYACDRALRAIGPRPAMVQAGGDIAVGAGRWRIETRTGFVELRNCGISSSGTVERGKHIIDPRTKHPVDTEWITVIAADATTSDALATAFAVRGPMNLPGVETR